MKRIGQAFTKCLMQHENCPRGETAILPSRVIDIERMRLHETEGKDVDKYAALSIVGVANN